MGRSGKPTIGLALGGGAAQAFAHIPVLEGLDELGVRPSVIAGTSMGALLGAAYASGMTGAEIGAYVVDTFRIRSEFIGRLWRSRPKRFKDVSIGIGQYDLERVLEAFLPETLPKTFDALRVPLRVVATDYYAAEQSILESGDLIPALAASAAVPMLFRPVRIGGRVMLDGGISNPVPFDLIGEADIVIAVDVANEPAGDANRSPGGIESLFGATSLLMRSLLFEKLKVHRPPDILLRSPSIGFNSLDFTKVGSIVRSAAPLKEEVKRRLGELIAEPALR
jgi:NTE family protein